MKKKSQGTLLIEKAFSKPRSFTYAAERLASNIFYDGSTNLEKEEAYIVSKEIKKSKETLINNPVYKAAIKNIVAATGKKFLELIHAEAETHDLEVRRKTEQLKADVAKEAFLQKTAKKLNKKELAQLKKLLPIETEE